MAKTIFSGPLSEAIDALGASLSAILVHVIILAVVVLADYGTGLLKARFLKQISSDIGYKGILKKLAYIPIVTVGIVTDWVIQSAALHAGLEIRLHAIGGILVFWLITVEVISILENISAMGVPVPGFLMTLVSKLKQTAEADGAVRAGESITYDAELKQFIEALQRKVSESDTGEDAQ